MSHRSRRVHRAVSTLPLTNAMGVLCLIMWTPTCIVSLAHLPITDGWYTALTFYTGLVGSIFGVKRWTYDPEKAQVAARIAGQSAMEGADGPVPPGP
jgi:hypothetical protein